MKEGEEEEMGKKEQDEQQEGATDGVPSSLTRQLFWTRS